MENSMLPGAYHALELHVTGFLDSNINSVIAQQVHMSKFTAETATFLAYGSVTPDTEGACVCVFLDSCSHAFFLGGGDQLYSCIWH
jgi:hypothetical protein